jgi:hypothetical protein
VRGGRAGRGHLREIDGAGAIGVDLIDHVLELGLGGVLAEGAHNCPQLLGGDGAIAILVEQGEGLLELGNLFLGELVGGHVDLWWA